MSPLPCDCFCREERGTEGLVEDKAHSHPPKIPKCDTKSPKPALGPLSRGVTTLLSIPEPLGFWGEG